MALIPAARVGPVAAVLLLLAALCPVFGEPLPALDDGWDVPVFLETSSLEAASAGSATEIQAERLKAVPVTWTRWGSHAAAPRDARNVGMKLVELQAQAQAQQRTVAQAGTELWWTKDLPWWMPTPPEWGPMPSTMYTASYHQSKYAPMSTPNYGPLYFGPHPQRMDFYPVMRHQPVDSAALTGPDLTGTVSPVVYDSFLEVENRAQEINMDVNLDAAHAKTNGVPQQPQMHRAYASPDPLKQRRSPLPPSAEQMRFAEAHSGAKAGASVSKLWERTPHPQSHISKKDWEAFISGGHTAADGARFQQVDSNGGGLSEVEKEHFAHGPHLDITPAALAQKYGKYNPSQVYTEMNLKDTPAAAFVEVESQEINMDINRNPNTKMFGAPAQPAMRAAFPEPDPMKEPHAPVAPTATEMRFQETKGHAKLSKLWQPSPHPLSHISEKDWKDFMQAASKQSEERFQQVLDGAKTTKEDASNSAPHPEIQPQMLKHKYGKYNPSEVYSEMHRPEVPVSFIELEAKEVNLDINRNPNAKTFGIPQQPAMHSSYPSTDPEAMPRSPQPPSTDELRFMETHGKTGARARLSKLWQRTDHPLSHINAEDWKLYMNQAKEAGQEARFRSVETNNAAPRPDINPSALAKKYGKYNPSEVYDELHRPMEGAKHT